MAGNVFRGTADWWFDFRPWEQAISSEGTQDENQYKELGSRVRSEVTRKNFHDHTVLQPFQKQQSKNGQLMWIPCQIISSVLSEKLVNNSFQLHPTSNCGKKVPSDKCILCGARQTNKHVLNNCSAPGVLERYKRRHDHVLSILAQWIKDRVGIESVLFADLSNPNFNSPADIFSWGC